MITIIGTGCGRFGMLPEGEKRIAQAQLMIGAPRLLESLPPHHAKTVPALRAKDILQIIMEEPACECVVLMSGDTGFYSGTASLLKLLHQEGLTAEIIPGISSVQYFASRLGRAWQDWHLCSAHGTDCDILAELKGHRSVFLLTGGDSDAAGICRQLTEAGLHEAGVAVGENLSYQDERISVGSAQEMARRTFAPLHVMLIELSPDMMSPHRSGSFPDSEFIRGQIPMTKQEVRAAVLSKLAVTPEDVCWDIGAGTGSVSIELALAGRAAWAVEQKEEACGLIRKNRSKFRAWNLRIRQGKAPEALAGLPVPDVVFVGGSSGQLDQILEYVIRINRAARICVSAVTLETLQTAAAWMQEKGMDTDITQISVSHARQMHALHFLTAANPIFLITGKLI